MKIALKDVLTALHGFDDVVNGPVNVIRFTFCGVAEIADVMVTGAAIGPLALAIGVKRDHRAAVVTSKRGYCIERICPEGDTLQTDLPRMFGGNAIAPSVINPQFPVVTGQYWHWLMIV